MVNEINEILRHINEMNCNDMNYIRPFGNLGIGVGICISTDIAKILFLPY